MLFVVVPGGVFAGLFSSFGGIRCKAFLVVCPGVGGGKCRRLRGSSVFQRGGKMQGVSAGLVRIICIMLTLKNKPMTKKKFPTSPPCLKKKKPR